MNEVNPPKWLKSSKCASTTCVEIAAHTGGVLIRDSKYPAQTPLSVTPAMFFALVHGAKRGTFDLPDGH